MTEHTADRGHGSADPRLDLRREEIAQTPQTEAGKRLLFEYRHWFVDQGWEDEGWDAEASAAEIARAILAIEIEARSQDTATARIAQVRLDMIDGIGVELSREVAQGSPFEPFDRIYVLRTITRVLDEARSRTRAVVSGETRTGGEE